MIGLRGLAVKALLCPMMLFSSVGFANDIIIIGDSIFAASGQIRSQLQSISPMEIRSYAVNGARMSGVISQYERARGNGISRTIIMNGGGNDVLQGNVGICRDFADSCRAIVDGVVEKARELFKSMKADGVETVVYLGYYYTKGVFAGGLDDALDYSTEKTLEVCEDDDHIRCIVVDPRDAFNGRSGLISWDGIHPSSSGSRLLAELIWESMVANDIEQDYIE